MFANNGGRYRAFARSAVFGLIATAAGAISPALADEWQPQGTVEIVVPADAGSNPDSQSRLLQAIWRETGIVKNTTVVLNKPGGGQSVAASYLVDRAPGQSVGIIFGSLLTAQVLKNHDFDYRKLTPLAMLGNENYCWVIKGGDNKIKDGADLFKRLRDDPTSVIAGISSPGGNGHIGMLAVLKNAGVDITKMKVVSFASGGETKTSLLGGHVDFTVTTCSNVAELQRTGDLRTIALTAPKRSGEPFQDVPTIGELGVTVPSFLSGWAAMMGPANMTPEQIAYWEQIFKEAVDSDQWKKDAATNVRESYYMNSADLTKFLADEYKATEVMVGETIGATK